MVEACPSCYRSSLSFRSNKEYNQYYNHVVLGGTMSHQDTQAISNLRDWHDEAHTLRWDSCPYEPCNRLDVTFRWERA